MKNKVSVGKIFKIYGNVDFIKKIKLYDTQRN